MYLAISWHCHSSWKPTAHPRVLENAENVVEFLFLKHCSLSLSHLFFSWLWGGLPDKLLLSLGASTSLSLHEACVFLQAVLRSTEWESPVGVHPSGTPPWRKGGFAEKSVGFQRGFAGEYDGPIHPHGR